MMFMSQQEAARHISSNFLNILVGSAVMHLVFGVTLGIISSCLSIKFGSRYRCPLHDISFSRIDSFQKHDSRSCWSFNGNCMQIWVSPFDDTGGIFKGSGPGSIRAATRNKFKSKIGELQFSLSRYEKLVRATVPIKNGENARFLLLLTFDSEAEADSIIQKRIIPYLAETKDYFLQ